MYPGVRFRLISFLAECKFKVVHGREGGGKKEGKGRFPQMEAGITITQNMLTRLDIMCRDVLI